MINNEQYLIQKYAEAREKQEGYTDSDAGRLYWKGSMDTYHSLLILGFSDWAETGTTGYYVFHRGMSYDAAIAAASLYTAQRELPIEVDPADMADAVEEDSYWKAKQSWSDSRVQTDDDE